MVEAAKPQSKADAEAKIKELAKLRADGGPNCVSEALEIAGAWGIRESFVEELFDDAERLAAVASEDDFFKNTAVQPSVEPTKVGVV